MLSYKIVLFTVRLRPGGALGYLADLAGDRDGLLAAAERADRLHLPFIPVRKMDKLPWKTIREEYALEYGTATIEMHIDAVDATSRVVVIDDLLATGGTSQASAKMVERLGATVVGFIFLVELTFLHGRDKLGGYDVTSFIRY